MDSRIGVLETANSQGDRFTASDGRILEQRMDFFEKYITESLDHLNDKLDHVIEKS